MKSNNSGLYTVIVDDATDSPFCVGIHSSKQLAEKTAGEVATILADTYGWSKAMLAGGRNGNRAYTVNEFQVYVHCMYPDTRSFASDMRHRGTRGGMESRPAD